MDFHQLNTFYHVARRLNFTRAAEDLNMSQPAVSRQIESLEKTIGMPLFNRTGRNVTLTDAGYVLYKQGEQILRMVESTQISIDALKNLESGSLRIGCSTTIGNYVIPQAVLEFTHKYPAIQVHVNIDSTKQMLQKVEEGDVDIAFISGPIDSTVLYVEPFATDEIVLVIGKNHPLAEQPTVHPESVFSGTLLIRNEGSHSRGTTLSHFHKLGWPVPKLIEFDTTEAIKQAVLVGSGIAFVSKFAIRFERQCDLVLSIDEEPFKIPRSFYLVSHKGRNPSPAMLAFKTTIKKHMQRFIF